ncbi:Uncharacterized protein SCF082_LOCUS26856 [Durusdinium trenchii]|uniref:Uncharacterized protein n=1 Tax=Durusdinium trenchii TaxID=1381693 RepID=A0ABP0M9E9_9DINO
MFGDQILETGQSAEITPLSIRIVKGYTKVQCIAFGLLLASDNDITPESEKVLEPFANLLDKGMNMDAVASSYTNMMLSFRGGERQPPNVLQMSLRFSAIMETRSMQGLHSKDWSAEDRLRKVVQEFHSTNGMLQKWFLDEDKVQSILNMITATSAGSRELIANHLHKFKWSQSALTSELLRKPRWLLKAVPRGCQPHFKVLLTVTETSQEMFLALVFHQFHLKTRKVRPNQRPRCRLSAQDWDAYINFACIYAHVLKEASLLADAPDLETIKKAFLDLDYFEEIEAIIKAEPAGWTVKNLCLWTEMVQRETPATAMGVAVDEKTVEEKEEELENIAMDDLHYVAVIDFTKLGCIGQQDINQHAQWMSNVLAKNPLRAIGVVICPLLTGTAAGASLRFVASHAWRYQSLPDPLPSPLAENEYVAPVTKGQLTSNDQRKNYTDLQETAQWLSGGKHTIIYHATSYDAAWEKAAVQLSCPVIGLTMDLACHKLASKLLRSHLLEEWKRDSGMIKGARYVPDSPGLPDTVTPPDLLVCKEVEGKLTIPSDVRQKFLGDPLRSAEWKKLLKSFEKLHGTASTPPAAAPSTPATAPATPAGSPATDASPWKHIFEGEPRTLTDLVAKYGEPSSTISAPGSSGFVIKVVEGPKFFLCAPVAGTFDCNEGPVLSHGAGSWLLDTKAEKMLQDNPDKAHVAKFESDQHLCILEAGGHLMYEQ